MSNITKDRKCSVQGCQNQALRSISITDVSKYLDLKPGKERRAYLCKEHYKEFKKKSKKDKKTEQLRYGGGGKVSGKRGFKGPMS